MPEAPAPIGEAAATPPKTGEGTAEKGKDEKGKEAPKPPEPFWAKYPVVTAFPRPGWFPMPPTGPGYYSLWDCIRGDYREKPPVYAYPRFGFIQYSFFDADWRYLDKPDNQDHDYLDCLKRVHFGDDNFIFTTGGDLRLRYANEVDSRLTGKNLTYDLPRVRAYGDLWYQDKVRLYAEFIYADSLFEDLPALAIDENRGDILNLFTDIKLCDIPNCEGKTAPVYVRVGRQELLYGSQRLISPLDWANTRRTFQGVKVFGRGEKWDVDLFCVQPVIPLPDRLDSVDNDAIFSGLWSTYRPKKGQNFDFYYLNLDQTRHGPTRLGLPFGPANTSTVGARYVGDANNWLWDVEGMVQFGARGSQSILANAYTVGGGYHFKDCCMNPQLWLFYDYASGDDRPGKTDTYGTFNQLFPFGHYYFGYIDAVGRQNIHDFNGQFTIYPTNWITLGTQYHVFRLASAFDALYSAAGVPLRRDPTGRAGTDVGQELDVFCNFHLDKHSDIYMSYSHLYIGDFIRRTGNAKSPDYLYVQYSYRW